MHSIMSVCISHWKFGHFFRCTLQCVSRISHLFDSFTFYLPGSCVLYIRYMWFIQSLYVYVMYVVYSLPSQIGAHAQVAKSIFDNAGNVVSLKPSIHCATAKTYFVSVGKFMSEAGVILNIWNLGELWKRKPVANLVCACANGVLQNPVTAVTSPSLAASCIAGRLSCGWKRC